MSADERARRCRSWLPVYVFSLAVRCAFANTDSSIILEQVKKESRSQVDLGDEWDETNGP